MGRKLLLLILPGILFTGIILEQGNVKFTEYIPDNGLASNIVAAGNSDQIKAGLKQTGTVIFYDSSINKVNATLDSIPAGLSAEDVINNYIKAIGGRDSLAAVHDRTTVMKGTVQGFPVTTTIYQKEPDLFKQELEAGDITQEIIFDGRDGKMQAGGQEMNIEGNELAKLKYEASIHLLLDLDSLGVSLKLSGMTKVNGKNTYKIEMSFPSGTKWIQYYDPTTGLKTKETKNITTSQGTFTQEVFYSDYNTVNGIKYPFTIQQSIGPQTMEFRVDSIKTNTGIPDSEFNF